MASQKKYWVKIGNRRLYLTQREKEVAELLVKNRPYKLIAEQLAISPRTVEYYISNIKLKCFVQKRQSLTDVLATLLKQIKSSNCEPVG